MWTLKEEALNWDTAGGRLFIAVSENDIMCSDWVKVSFTRAAPRHGWGPLPSLSKNIILEKFSPPLRRWVTQTLAFQKRQFDQRNLMKMIFKRFTIRLQSEKTVICRQLVKTEKVWVIFLFSLCEDQQFSLQPSPPIRETPVLYPICAAATEQPTYIFKSSSTPIKCRC